MGSYLYIKTWQPLYHQETTNNCQNCHIWCKKYNIRILEYKFTCPDSLLNVTMCKHIHLVIKYINSHLNHILVERSNVPMKSLSVGNDHEENILGEYTTTAAMKEDIHRDMDHLLCLIRSTYRWRYPATNKKENKSIIKSCWSQHNRSII